MIRGFRSILLLVKGAKVPLVLGGLLIGSFVSSCTFHREKGVPQGDVAGLQDDGSVPDYALVQRQVFAPYCVSCHGRAGGISLESYPMIKAHLAAVERTTLIDRTMPKDRIFPAAASSILARWIKAGAPEFKPSLPVDPIGAPSSFPPVSPSGTPVVQEPLLPTYGSLFKQVFEPHCLSCHKGQPPDGDVSFETLQLLKRSPRQPLLMEDEGEPNTSGLMLALVHEDETKRMPPSQAGPRLSEEVIEVIRQWIKEGSPE